MKALSTLLEDMGTCPPDRSGEAAPGSVFLGFVWFDCFAA